jgi:hypothetical protein
MSALVEPERLRPQGSHAAGWEHIGQVTDGMGVADGWQLGAVCVVSSVDFVPVPRHWEYHLSVRLLESPTPPQANTLDAVCKMFGMPADAHPEPSKNPLIVHLFARVPW